MQNHIKKIKYLILMLIILILLFKMQDYNKSDKEKYYYKSQRESHSPVYKQEPYYKNERNPYYRENDYRIRPIDLPKEPHFDRQQERHFERSPRERYDSSKLRRYSKERQEKPRDFYPKEKEAFYNKDARDSKNHYIQQRDKFPQTHQAHYYQGQSSGVYQDNLLNKKREQRDRSSSPKKQQKNNFPIICAINRTYFKYFEDNFSSIKKSINDQVYNINDFRIKSFKNSEDCFLLIDSFNFTALKKCFRIFCEKTYDYLNGIYGKMSYLKTFILVPNRKLY
jgi:hypothetical protein